MSAQTIERLGERARLATWRGDGIVAHLAPAATTPLSVEFITDCLEWLRARGYGSVVTSALSSRECGGFLRAGFDLHEELDLLAHDLTGLPSVPRGLHRARRRDRPVVIELDAIAFPPFWRLHEGGLEEALLATPSVRFRVAGPGWFDTARRGVGGPRAGGARGWGPRRGGEAARGAAGYAIAGRGGDTGYLQRLAVHPASRGQGLGRALVVDALVWLRRRGASRAMVNTQRTNEGARALYRACGFRLLPEGLSVLAREL
ncbi:MAG: GNAT family N-acetyltransferase [Acidimicrobiia bacterium]